MVRINVNCGPAALYLADFYAFLALPLEWLAEWGAEEQRNRDRDSTQQGLVAVIIIVCVFPTDSDSDSVSTS